MSFKFDNFLGSAAGAAIGTRAGSRNQEIPFLEDKPGFLSKMQYTNPEMGRTWRDSKLKEMFFEKDVENTIFWDKFMMGAIVLGVIAIVLLLVGAGGWAIIPALLIGANYWYWFTYKMEDWRANKEQIINDIIGAFSGSQQQLNSNMASGNYLTDLIAEFKKNGNKQQLEERLASDMRGGNNIFALGMWTERAGKSS